MEQSDKLTEAQFKKIMDYADNSSLGFYKGNQKSSAYIYDVLKSDDRIDIYMWYSCQTETVPLVVTCTADDTPEGLTPQSCLAGQYDFDEDTEIFIRRNFPGHVYWLYRITPKQTVRNYCDKNLEKRLNDQ